MDELIGLDLGELGIGSTTEQQRRPETAQYAGIVRESRDWGLEGDSHVADYGNATVGGHEVQDQQGGWEQEDLGTGKEDEDGYEADVIVVFKERGKSEKRGLGSRDE